jgi:hypothetical protein
MLTFGGFTGGFFKGQRSTTACIAAQSTFMHTVTLGATNIGKHNISATATIDKDSQAGSCGPNELIEEFR